MLDVIYVILWILYVPACFGLIIIVLLQKGKGAGFAGALGMGGGGEAVFGPRATKSLPVRLTYIFATAFMVIALVMSLIAGYVGKGAAPELAAVDDMMAPAAATGLDDLGIGTGQTGAAQGTVPAAADDTPAGAESPTPAAPPAEEDPEAEGGAAAEGSAEGAAPVTP